MDEYITDRKRKDPWVYSPGPQGAVGSTQVQIEFRHSEPHMKFRYDPEWYGERSCYAGSNVSDGQVAGYVSGGGPARVLDSAFGHRGSFKDANGFTYTDIVANPERFSDATFASIPDYTWRNKIASLIDATTTGQMFPAPDGILPKNFVPRGGTYPTLVSQSAGTVPAWTGVDPLLNMNIVSSRDYARELNENTQRVNADQNRSIPFSSGVNAFSSPFETLSI